MKNYQIWLFCVISLMSGKLYAQPGIGLPNVLLPSPTAMQFQKYGDYPVGHFTGVPEISIPLYVIKEGDIELPITMSYHASGIKVEDPSGFFGLGWVLNTGAGIISNTIHGPLDGGFGMSSSTKIADELTQTFSSDNYTFLDHVESGSDKMEYDVFSYNFGGQYGKFVLDGTNTDRTATLFPYKPIKITPYFLHDYNSFQITDEKGVIHSFGAFNNYGAVNSGDGGLSWLGNNIVSPSNPLNKVSFSYVFGIESRTVRNEQIYFDDFANDIGPLINTDHSGSSYGCANNGGFYAFQDVTYRMANVVDDAPSINTQNYSSALPNEIVFSSGRLKFSYNATTRMLEKMEVFNTSNQLLQSIEFTISAYDGVPSSRRKLDYIKFFDAQHTLINQYHFTYLSNYMPEYADCNSVDFWGYYNGKGNQNILPRWENFMTVPGVPGYQYAASFGNADRSSDEIYMKSCMLERIDYPTGGYALFDFEANKYISENAILTSAGGLRIKTITNYDIGGQFAGRKRYEYGSSGAGILEVPIKRENYYYTQVVNRLSQNYRTYLFNYRRLIFSSNSLVDLTPHGSPVIYPNVTEYIENDNNENIGKTTYRYDYNINAYNDLYTSIETAGWEAFPFNSKRYQKYIKDWALGGDLLQTVYFRKTAGGYDEVRAETNEYEENVRGQIRNMSLYRKEIFEPSSCTDMPSFPFQVDQAFYFGAQPVQIWAAADYYYIIGEKRLKKKTEATASSDGNGWITKATDYFYDNAIHAQVTRAVTTNSKGQIVKTEFKRPHEFANIDAPNVYDEMVTRHMWTPVIEQSTYIDDVFQQSIKNNYGLWNNNTLVAPYFVEGKVRTNATETRLRYGGYDDNGNIMSVAKENDLTVSYVWDYQKTRPVAEVRNASFQDIAYTSFETNSYGNWTISNASVIADITAPTGSKYLQLLSSGIISKPGISATQKYVVTYWSKNGAYTVSSSTAVKTGSVINGWTLYEHQVTGVSTISLTSSSGGNIDELRLYPAGAEMTTYTFEPLIGMTSASDNNNRIAYYNYDGAGRLMNVKDAYRNILKKYAYAWFDPVEAALRAPNWQNTGQTYCEKCTLNDSYYTGTLKIEQKDLNPNSYTYQQSRWLSSGSSLCLNNNEWQNTTTPLRCRVVSGYNTGEQEREQKNMNPCSGTYNQTKWVIAGTNTAACPIPSNIPSQNQSGDYVPNDCPSPSYAAPVYVSIPAGMFTSSISQEDANRKARDYGQNYANTHKQPCIYPPFTLFFDNEPGQGFGGFYVELYDSGNNLMYAFNPNNYGMQSLGNILPGTYNVRVYPRLSENTFNYYVGCSASGTGIDVIIPNVSLSIDCNIITVNLAF